MSAEIDDKTKTKSTSKKKSTAAKAGAVKSKNAAQDKKLLDLTAQNSELEDKLLRLKAEFENFRRRKDKEFMALLQYEGQDIIKKLLPIIDDLERVNAAFSDGTADTGEATWKGIEMILAKFRKVLAEQGVEAFESVGALLDAELHDAMMVVQQEKTRDNEIVQEYEKGYRYKDKVLRHAKVVVNKQ